MAPTALADFDRRESRAHRSVSPEIAVQANLTSWISSPVRTGAAFIVGWFGMVTTPTFAQIPS